MKKLCFVFFLTLNVLLAQEIKIGSENAYKPFAYLDEKGNATGFDNELVKIVLSYMPKSEAKFVSVTWNAIFSGLDSAKFDVIANQIAKSKEREAKYLFSKYPYFYGISALIAGNNKQIHSFNELKNSKIGVTVGSNHAKNLEDYAKAHPELNLQIVYYKTSPSLVSDLAVGRVEAIINDPIAALDYAKAQNVKITPTKIYLQETPVFFVFRKDSKALADSFDEALKKAIKEGKVSALIKEYFGEEYAQILQKEFDKIQ